MSSSLIGVLLDEACRWAYLNKPSPVLAQLPDMNSGKPAPATPRSVARALLAEHLRNSFLPGSLVDFRDEAPCLDYERLLAWCRDPLYPLPDSSAIADLAPDFVLGAQNTGPVSVIEVGYGFQPATAMAAIDRLLELNWLTYAPYGRRPANFVAYVFVHEKEFGEIAYETDQFYLNWIRDHYGPFNGMDRIYQPMMPRFTRSAYISPRDGTVISAIDLESRPTGFVACCISYQTDRP
jgi:hypothetical protein